MVTLLIVIIALCAVCAISDPAMGFLFRVFPKLDAWVDNLANKTEGF